MRRVLNGDSAVRSNTRTPTGAPHPDWR